MKRKICAALLAATVLGSVMPVFAADVKGQEAVYLGVEGYGTITNDKKPEFKHRFSIDGKEFSYLVENDKEHYTLENKLQEGYIYDIDVQNDMVKGVEMMDGDAAGPIEYYTSASVTVGGKEYKFATDMSLYRIDSKAGGSTVTELPRDTTDWNQGKTVRLFLNDKGEVEDLYFTFVGKDYTPPVSGVPGKKTLKNFLATAMEPVGTALYVYGGTWDWQDVGSSNQATSIGVAKSWTDFYQSQDLNYTYKYAEDHSASYYPHEAWNQYYYAGIDCSGYVGWSVYNLMNTESGHEGYVCSATKMAKGFADEQHWGTMDYGTTVHVEGEDDYREFSKSEFKPGDIFSMNGHVWISLGTCPDGSVVIMHSTPSDSASGQPGGGVQISGVGKNKNCQAYRLADYYMSKYFANWDARYGAVCRDFDDYTNVTGERAGKFSWDLKNVLTDPDGYAKMTPAEILADLFQDQAFEDVDPNAWFYQAVGKIADADVMNGVSDKEFAPNAQMTRAQLAQILYTRAGKPAVDAKDMQTKFADVKDGDWFHDAVYWARANGVASGYADGRFGVNDPITREQMVAMLYQAAGKPAVDAKGMDFADKADISGYAVNAMEWAVQQGILSGTPDHKVMPQGLTTRAQAAQMLSVLYHL